ncbi:enoyl-CoA hydratase/isomerase family protein [Corynebacterium uropygiale]|uniref:3-hydroxyisobutyryl-CoA hydrolase n=1 Tax=Corynebacterium uropygiale TaxID=1775911 RepID=A0A9X1U7J0_9CORY|nr:enoyl-CoA hydratase/isomerase family protein [Corynebacterium uropygiale]MCF4006802.1 enoyl-CoA hydratase/isomerase family protein [Corynebacterium uropygiale]
MSNHDHTHDDATVRASIENTTGVLELNRPKALNSLNPEMISAISAALEEWRDDPRVTQVLVRSSSPKAFCAGGDVRFAREGILEGNGEAVDGFFEEEYRMNEAIASFPKPYVALIDGIVMGGGLGVSAHGSHRVVTEKVLAAMPEMAIGYVTDVGMTWALAHMVGKKGEPSAALAAFLGLTGWHVKVADAVWSGLATDLIRSEDVDAFADALIADGVEAALERFRVNQEEPSQLEAWYPEIKRCFSERGWAAISQAVEESSNEEFREAVRTLCASASPSSLVATAEVFAHNAEADSLHEAIWAEWAVGKRLLRTHDFAEGVRAVLVDKDRQAAFEPSAPEEVDAAAWREVVAAKR